MKNVVLITGASSGIGKATALQLVKEGNTVYATARRVEEMKDIERAGGNVLKLDVTSEEDIVRVVGQVIAEQGRIDVLINNAGYGLYGAVEDVPIDVARRQFEVNIFGLARITQEVLPHMRSKKSGKIINVSSMGGKIYMPLGAWYHGTKHALEGWSDSLRLEVKDFNIKVVIIEPGLIKTGFGDVMTKAMLEISGNGAYAKLAKAMDKAVQDAEIKPNGGSPASVISNVISKAVKSAHPKTRYRAGKMSKLMVWLRLYMGDKIFDKLVMSQIK